jgi:spore germination protein YaaH
MAVVAVLALVGTAIFLLVQPAAPSSLAPAGGPPQPASELVRDAPALRPHEVVGFAPYWNLAQSGGFDVNDLTTLVYFGLTVNPDGTLQRSGPGWTGLVSQALADLVTRAHQAGDRAVLAVSCFDQGDLDALTHDPAAPARLASGILSVLEAENLDGVNIDLEGSGSADQAGLSALVTQVSASVHRARPHDQVTVDTYASSAGDPDGFFNVPALAAAVDAVVVEQYQLNLASPGSTASPLTSAMYSDQRSVEEYRAVMPPAKVILAAPFFGYDWPTSDGTLSAGAQEGPATVTDKAVAATGHPVYWDRVTNTAWTSYLVGDQWHESFFENPDSLYLFWRLAQGAGFGGVGAWALGDESSAASLSALAGVEPPTTALSTGPAATSPSTSGH